MDLEDTIDLDIRKDGSIESEIVNLPQELNKKMEVKVTYTPQQN